MKDSKAEAEYEPRAVDQGKRCELCRYMLPERFCVKVLGRVNPKGWCHHFNRGPNAYRE